VSDCWLLVIRAVQVIECKEVCEALFNEGRAFKPESGCYTAALLRSLTGPQRDMGMGWPSGAQPDLTGPKAYATSRCTVGAASSAPSIVGQALSRKNFDYGALGSWQQRKACHAMRRKRSFWLPCRT